ncbi:nitroreductase/quinone reductase family protein [Glaciibacter psychrotolerans]|uniref:Deazaflavin-dependent oxidoreductase (Nitroreductase family) n=1 Tax=Glaciibacter psychrotolerans TaxID=670054 RepID=A0A7Z0J6D1_9MICO|nr:nitroreductase/quinone reductase family protein [Leifsonia psychrotolerans]NYJ19808.1 deazaflavin-dependent oxidoreductase (nitroreductase family) [Leifsonia psychrotolerans]
MSIRYRATDLSMKLMSASHRALLAVTGGRLGWKIGAMPAVELHTIGRSTGHRRSIMLTAPLHDEERYILVASKGGDDRQPQWYLNLVAHPDIELTVRGQTMRMHARTATAAERADLWPQIVAVYGGYAGYQVKTEREIPVVICEPVVD